MKPEQQFVYTRTYSRYLEEEKRRESYPETVDRYINYMADKLDISKYFADMGREAILDMDVMPSMRAMWAAGPAADNCNVSIYNCSALAIDSIKAFAEVLYILMSGTGAGFSIEASYVSKLPPVAKFVKEGSAIVVADSKEGWATALDTFLKDAILQGIYRPLDVSGVRPKGARLKTMGGRSSGPEPFVDLIAFCKSKLLSLAGARLRPIDCLDILNKIADIVVVGGVRRSSQISLSDLNDREIAGAKSGQFWIDNPQRSMSNNSVVYESKPTFTEFLDEFSALIKSGTGERGIFNRQAAKDWAKYTGRRDSEYQWLTNPCWIAGTLVQTKDGHYPIESLVGKVVDIWDGVSWQQVNNFRVTGENQPTLKVTMQDGSEEVMTPYHKVILEDGTRIEAKDLLPGDRLKLSEAPVSHGLYEAKAAYMKGFLLGDGTYAKDRPILYLYNPKACCKEALIASANEIAPQKLTTTSISEVSTRPAGSNRVTFTGLTARRCELLPWSYEYKRQLPKEVFSWNFESKCKLIAGLMDSDGTASDTKNGFMYQLTSINKRLLLDVQALLKTLGVYSKLKLTKKAGVQNFNDGYGEYNTKACYRLTISQASSVMLASICTFYRLVNFSDKKCSYKLKIKRNTVVSVEEFGIVDKVYCCTVDGSHSFALTNGILYGQCSEIVLRPSQKCNLSEVVARAGDSLEVLKNKVKIATMFGAWQATFTNFKYLSEAWKINAEAERLLGVSVTGIMDHKVLGSCTPKANKWWNELRNVSISEAEKWSKRLGINMPAAITCVKPSGTVSQLVDSASGIHARFANYYIRRYRISTTDPLFNMLVAQGMPWSPENGQFKESCSTAVLSYPVKAPTGAITRHDLTALQQLEHWQMVKHCWTEHNPSVTIYVEPDEWFKVADWVWTNFDSIGGLSFLPKTDHIYQQAPYEEVDETKYKELVAAMPKIDYSQLSKYEQEDNTEGSRSYACVGDKCELS